MGNRRTVNQNTCPSISLQQEESRWPERAPDGMMRWPHITEEDLT